RLVELLDRAVGSDADRIAAVIARVGTVADLDALTRLADRESISRPVLDAVQHIVRRYEDSLPAVLADADSKVAAVLLPVVRSRSCAPIVRELLSDDDDEV